MTTAQVNCSRYNRGLSVTLMLDKRIVSHDMRDIKRCKEAFAKAAHAVFTANERLIEKISCEANFQYNSCIQGEVQVIKGNITGPELDAFKIQFISHLKKSGISATIQRRTVQLERRQDY